MDLFIRILKINNHRIMEMFLIIFTMHCPNILFICMMFMCIYTYMQLKYLYTQQMIILP